MSGWRVDPRRERGRVEGRAVAQHQTGHHLVAGLVVGHAVHRREHDVGMRAQRLLDRPGREVLAVDADPVGVATREVEVAVGVEVPEVARPVPAEAGRLLVRLRVVVVALERTDASGVHDLADALVRVRQPALGVELGDAASRCPSSSTTLTSGPASPSAPSRRSASRLTAMPPSVAPYASMTSTPNRRRERRRRPAASPRCRTRPAAGCRRRRAARAARGGTRAACRCS